MRNCLDTSDKMNFRELKNHLASLANDPVAVAAYVDRYLAYHRGNFPIVEGTIAHFICKEQPNKVVGVGGEWNGWDAPRAIMTPIGGGLLHYQHEFENDACLDYFFYEIAVSRIEDLPADLQARRRLNMRSTLDPLNAHFGESGFGPRSELAMPGYRRPAVTREQKGIKTGILRKGSIESKFLHQEERSYTVYLPPGYSESGAACPTVYFNDGGDYLTMGKAPIILDNLISKGAIPPVVAVFLPPVHREGEYNCNDDYVRFVCDELVPEMQRQYNLRDEAASRAVVGPSLGGLISLYLGGERPDVFGLVGAQSSAVHSTYGLNKFDARRTYAVPLPVRLHLVIGSYEDCFDIDYRGRCHDLLNPVRELCAVLKQHGYAYRYLEPHMGHSWTLWRDYLADILLYFFGEPRQNLH
jgi:enterochelin esterase-like enzyme